MTKNKETVLEKAKRIYPENLFGESFNDGPLGGCNVFGDPATHYPIMWKYLTEKLDCMKHWKHALSYPYHFERRGLFFINEQA